VHQSDGTVAESILVDAMIGSAAPDHTIGASSRASAGDVVVSITGVHANDDAGVERLRGAALTVRAGEIVGVAGVERSGHRELLRVCAGRLGTTAGTVVTDPDAGFVPEDRHRDAVVPEFSLVENVALSGAGRRRGRMPWNALRATTQKLIGEFSIAATEASQSLGTLSGGNQQRLVLARELERAGALIVLENPTRGLDIGATAAIHDALRRARTSGTAVLLYSADLDELLALADRVVVCHAGNVIETPTDLTAIGRALVGSAPNMS
jgi:simple sugar transport system ATP-binding protein